MERKITLARPLPGGSTLRKMGDQCTAYREQIDSAGHHITFVRFDDGELRVLVDKDIAEASDEANSAITITAQAKDIEPNCGFITIVNLDTGDEYPSYDIGGES